MKRNYILLSALMVLLAAMPPARADDDLELLEQKAFQAAVERVAPSVVAIETVGGLEKVGKVLFGTGPTTGLVVDKDGYIASSAFNFVNKPASILVRLADGTRKPAEIVATDHNRMLVLLKIDVDKPLPVPEILSQDKMRVGQSAIAVGRTFEGGRPNVSVGILSAVNRVWGKAIQTDAAVSPGNYGGPLVDIAGRVMGVIVPLSPRAVNEVAGVEWYDSGIGMAVPADHLMKILPRLKKGEDLKPGLMGISFASRNLATAEAVIGRCPPNSPAYAAGFRAKDKIAEVDGVKIVRAAQVKEHTSRRYAGYKLRVVAMRGDKRIEGELTLVDKLDPYQFTMLGILPMRRPRAEGATAPAGVTVRYVYPKGPAAAAGVKQGDVIVKLADEAVNGGDQLRQRVGGYLPGEVVELEMRRGSEKLKLKVKLGRPTEDIPAATLPPSLAKTKPVEAAKPTKAKPVEKKPAAKKPVEKKPAKGKSATGVTTFRLLLEEGPGARVSTFQPLAVTGQTAEDVPAQPKKPDKPEKPKKPAKPKEPEKPKLGTVPIKVTDDKEDKRQAWAYVPSDYKRTVGYGLVVWLDGLGDFDQAKIIARWKPLCDRHQLILLVPKSPAKEWKSEDAGYLGQLITKVSRGYTIDRSRFAICGTGAACKLACAAAYGSRGRVRALALIAGPPFDEPPAGAQGRCLAFYVATVEKAADAARVEQSIDRARRMHYPVTVRKLGEKPRDLTADELAELARLIDTLDRI